MWIVCITSVRHVLTVNGYGGRQTKENEKSWCFKGWETLVNNIKEIIDTSEKDEIYKNLKAAKIIIIRKEQELYALDMGTSTIVNLHETNIVLSKLKMFNNRHNNQKESQVNIPGQWVKILNSTSSAHHSNREWEVGGNSDWDYVDEDRKFRR